MKLRNIILLVFTSVLIFAPTIYGANEAPQPAQPSWFARMRNGFRSLYNPFAAAQQEQEANDDQNPDEQQNPAEQNPAPDQPDQDDEQEDARPFSESIGRAREVIGAQFNRARVAFNNGGQRVRQAANNPVGRVRAAVRERIRNEIVGAIQEEAAALQNNPQHRAQLLAGAQNIVAAIANDPQAQQLGADLGGQALNAAQRYAQNQLNDPQRRAQLAAGARQVVSAVANSAEAQQAIPEVVGAIAEEFRKPKNADAINDMAQKLMNSGPNRSLLEKVKNSMSWLKTAGVLTSTFFAYKIGCWFKDKFWGPPAKSPETIALANSIRQYVARPHAEPVQALAPVAEPIAANNDHAIVSDAIRLHEAHLQKGGINGKQRSIVQAQLNTLRAALNNQASMTVLKHELGDLGKAFAK